MEPYEYELLRRSIAMLTPGAPAIEREEALSLLHELASIRAELDQLKQGLRDLVAGIEAVETSRRHQP
jgi:hypothetical protein